MISILILFIYNKIVDHILHLNILYEDSQENLIQWIPFDMFTNVKKILVKSSIHKNFDLKRKIGYNLIHDDSVDWLHLLNKDVNHYHHDMYYMIPFNAIKCFKYYHEFLKYQICDEIVRNILFCGRIKFLEYILEINYKISDELIRYAKKCGNIGIIEILKLINGKSPN